MVASYVLVKTMLLKMSQNSVRLTTNNGKQGISFTNQPCHGGFSYSIEYYTSPNIACLCYHAGENRRVRERFRWWREQYRVRRERNRRATPIHVGKTSNYYTCYVMVAMLQPSAHNSQTKHFWRSLTNCLGQLVLNSKQLYILLINCTVQRESLAELIFGKSGWINILANKQIDQKVINFILTNNLDGLGLANC